MKNEELRIYATGIMNLEMTKTEILVNNLIECVRIAVDEGDKEEPNSSVIFKHGPNETLEDYNKAIEFINNRREKCNEIHRKQKTEAIQRLASSIDEVLNIRK